MPIDPEIAAKITAALDGLTPEDATTDDPFTRTLEDFSLMVTNHATIGKVLGVAVERVPALLGGRQLVAWPRVRRDQRGPLLTFARDGTSLALVGDQRRVFAEPTELLNYLLEFLKSPAFRETFSLYAERSAKPAKGFLRAGGPNELSLKDILVRVDPIEQAKLADAVVGSQLTVSVTEDGIPSTSSYAPTGSYSCLVVGGYGVWVRSHRRTKGRILEIDGIAMSEAELA